ncbi:hypothetical protein R5R35_004454 [Gryllus longicercus]
MILVQVQKHSVTWKMSSAAKQKNERCILFAGVFDAWKTADRNTRSESVFRFIIRTRRLPRGRNKIHKADRVVCANISSHSG